MTGIFDPGLQLERTALAWDRTAVGLLAGSIVSLRVLPPLFGNWSLCIGMLGIASAAGFLLGSSRRYQRRSELLQHTTHPEVADGRLLAQLAAMISTLAALSIILVAWVAIAS